MNNKSFLKYLIFLFLSINISFSFVIDHNPATVINYNEPLDIQIFTDFPSEDIIKAELFLKADNQISYLKIDVEKTSDNYYETVIPPEFIIGDYLEYYILVELSDGKYMTIPENDPHTNPFSIKIVKYNSTEEIVDLLKADFEIIAPKSNQKLISNDVIISLSYFKVKDLNVNKIKIYIDNIDKTSSAAIRKNNLFMIPYGLSDGKHTIKVILENRNGVKFKPIVWDFHIDDGEDLFGDMSFSGKLLNNYTNNEIDGNIISTNMSNLYLDVNSDLFDINSKFRKSSLENKLSQPYDRFYVKLKVNDSFNIQYGDFYPRFNDFILNGNRVRGVGLDFGSKFFQINLIKGQLDRSIQGNPQNGSSIISDYYLCNDSDGSCACACADATDASAGTTEALCEDVACDDGSIGVWTPYTMDVSRNNYFFKKDLYGLRLGVGIKDRLNFAFNILKVEDNINSVNQSLNNTIIDIPYYMSPFNEYNSSECIDINDDSLCDLSDLNINYDSDGNVIPGDTTPVPIQDYPCGEHYDSKNERTIFISTYECTLEDGSLCTAGNIYNHIQNVWEVRVSDEGNNLQEFINSCTFSDNINVNHLSNNWYGNKPKDNISLGTDFYFASKNNNFKIKSSLALSVINNNTWEPVMTTEDLDVLNDNYQDCYLERTYVSVEDVSYWDDCKAYNASGAEITNQLEPLQSGTNLNDLPHYLKPENLAEYYHWNMGSVPVFPFFPIFMKYQGSCDLGKCGSNDAGERVTEEVCEILNYTNTVLLVTINTKIDCDAINGDWIDNECLYAWKEIDDEAVCLSYGGIWDDEVTLTDILNQAEVAYNLDLSLNIKKHQLQVGVKKVGSQFNSLGNPYIQKDMIENYFVDRMRLLDNKLYMSFKIKNIKTGILEETNSFKTDKIDLNLNYYPGINLPSISFSIGTQFRKGGKSGTTWEEFLELCGEESNQIETDNDCYEEWGVYDTEGGGPENEDPDGIIVQDEFLTLANTRSKTRIDHYNFGYNQGIMLKRKQNISFNYYHSTKQDLLYDELIESLESYISPRSKNSSSNLNITTYYSNNFNSKIFYSNSTYDYAQKTSDYYLNQTINRIGGGFSYHNNSYIDNIGVELTYSDASGNSKYNQIGLKMFARLTLFEDLNMNLSYKYLNKKLSTEKYHNNVFKVNLSYRF